MSVLTISATPSLPLPCRASVGLPLFGKVLGHAQPATMARYAHIAADPVKAAATSVAGKIESAMAGHNSRTASVVKLRP